MFLISKIFTEIDSKIKLIPINSKITKEFIYNSFPNKKIFVCDFYIQDSEFWDEIEGGYCTNNIVNIDHHAPTDRMAQYITSTVLSIQYVNKYGPVSDDSIIVINHVDCDSLLSSHIMAGILPPLELFAEASIDADHTGKLNPISDLLQSIASKRDILYSINNLIKFLKNEKIDNEAEILKNQEIESRNIIKNYIEKGYFKINKYVTYATLPEKENTAYYPSFFPNTWVICTGSPYKNTNKTEFACRLGLSAPKWLKLNRLDLPEGYNGRWNAGANGRSGGSNMDIEDFVKIINEKINNFLKN